MIKKLAGETVQVTETQTYWMNAKEYNKCMNESDSFEARDGHKHTGQWGNGRQFWHVLQMGGGWLKSRDVHHHRSERVQGHMV